MFHGFLYHTFFYKNYVLLLFFSKGDNCFEPNWILSFWRLSNWLVKFFPQIFPSMGVTRLDGSQGKKLVWRPHVRTWDLLEAHLLYWRKFSWPCCDFSAPSAVIRPPGNCAPFPPRYGPASECYIHKYWEVLSVQHHHEFFLRFNQCLQNYIWRGKTGLSSSQNDINCVCVAKISKNCGFLMTDPNSTYILLHLTINYKHIT